MQNYDPYIYDVRFTSLAYSEDLGVGNNGLTFYCAKVTYDGSTYSIADDSKYLNLLVGLTAHDSNVYISIKAQKYISNSENFQYVTLVANDTIATGKALSLRGYISPVANLVPDAWASYISQFATTFIPNVLTYSSQIVNIPRLTYENIGYGGLRYIITPENPLILRASDGFRFNASSHAIIETTVDVPISNDIIKESISSDGKEYRLSTVLETTVATFTLHASPCLIPLLSIRIDPLPEPNRTITNNLTNITTSNPSTSVQYGASYSATLTADSGQYISDISIVMGGENITSEVYSNGEINIPSVTGDVVITASTSANPTITNDLTGCTNSNTATSIGYGETYSATITADSGYSLDGASVLITMGGVEQYGVYSNGVITIPNVSGNIAISIVANTIKTFTFKSSDGNTTFATINAVRLTSILFTINGNTRTLKVNGAEYSWLLQIPSGKELVGLSLTAESDRFVIPVGVEVVVNYRESTTFYEVIVDEGQQADTFTLMLYRNSAESNRVDKTSYLEYIGTLNGVLRTTTSMMNPVIAIEYDNVVNFNYIYIPIWNRYYFVTDIQYGIKKIAVVTLKEDVLMTFKNEIYQQNGFVTRNENEYNEYVIDSERLVNDNPIIEKIEVNSTFFSDELLNFIVGNVVGD